MNDSEALATVRAWCKRAVALCKEHEALAHALLDNPGGVGFKVSALIEPRISIRLSHPNCDFLCFVDDGFGFAHGGALAYQLAEPHWRLGDAVNAARPNLWAAEADKRVEYLRELQRARARAPKP